MSLDQWSSTTLFAECPNCHKLLELDTEFCPECREPISEEYAVPSAVIVAVNAHACYDAKEISQSNLPFVIVQLLSTAITCFFPVEIRRFFPFVGLLATGAVFYRIGRWYYRYGKFSLGDTSYLSAKKNMRKTCGLWIWVLAVQIALIILIVQRR